ncbi:hypothetical protein BKA65DRAFT_303740 [Rhexocercosporidium sp. MPI-PUGE-AT-0058]|nr:hypothetical protein BKA65DRAFT_303740 [Rhexocercosporidium sp. MPI-PUGE-AT-0058]
MQRKRNMHPEDEDAEVAEAEAADAETERSPSPDVSRASALAEVYRMASLLNLEVVEPRNGLDHSALFLENLPLEIHQMVYEQLLVNPILGGITSISKYQVYGANTKYDLWRAILRVNEQIHEEATHSIYTTNTFYMECLPVRGPSPNVYGRVNLSLLTRYFDNAFEWFLFLRNATVFSNVYNWKFAMSVIAWNGYVLNYPGAFSRSAVRLVVARCLPRLRWPIFQKASRTRSSSTRT